MRRSLVLSLVVAIAVIAVGAVAFTASQGARRAVVAAGKPSINGSPTPSTAGDQLTISGSVPGASGGRAVLWQRLSNQRHYHRVTAAQVDGSGHYSIVLKPGTV